MQIAATVPTRRALVINAENTKVRPPFTCVRKASIPITLSSATTFTSVLSRSVGE